MHDPWTQAFDIPNYKTRQRCPWLPHLVTIWHVDPEKDGSDDSCDWFGGRKIACKKTLGEITKAFLFEGRDGGAMSWFDSDPHSPDLIGVGLGMFRIAANCHFGHWSRRADRFLNGNLFDILHFIDNNCDSINSSLRRANAERGRKRQDILEHLARIVYGWILRRSRPWWRHPRWHVWHWSVQVHPWQILRRWLLTRCAGCGKRFAWGEAPVSSQWDDPPIRWFRGEEGLYHGACHPAAIRAGSRPPEAEALGS